MAIKKPVQVIAAVPKDGKIKFVFPRYEIFLDENVSAMAWNILELCNGINTIDEISKILSDIDTNFIRGFLNDLGELGVIIDSRNYYKYFYAISANPTDYLSDITIDEIEAHANSARLPIKAGESYKFNNNANSTLYKLQEKRQSCRSFSARKLSCDEVGKILDIGYSLSRHSVPSAGGLYPMKLFVVALENQKDFPAGYYEFDSQNNQLVLFNDSPDHERICYMMDDRTMPFNAPVVIIIAADADRQPYKYSNRGYQFMLIEAGEIAQNISLATLESGFMSCVLGGFLDNVVLEELRLDGCLPLLTMVVGEASENEVESVWQTVDKYEKMFVGDGKPVESTWCIDQTFVNNFGKAHFQFLARSANGHITSGISTCLAEAKLIAIIEAYERQCSAKVRWDTVAKATELPCDWLDPRVITPLTDLQYHKIERLQKFSEQLSVEWVKGTRISDGKPVFVPIDLVFYPIEELDRKLFVNTCSSGFAAYTNYEEATKRGLLEIIERDAMMRNWYEAKSSKRLSKKILPVHLQKRIEFWRTQGKTVFVLDISKNGVIIVETIIKSNTYPCFVSGAASSFNSFENAAIKSFQEAESRLIYGLNNDNGMMTEPEEVLQVLDHELLYAQSTKYHEYIKFLWSDDEIDVKPIATATFDELCERLKAVVVDVSETDSPIKVVKVISPELIPLNFGYGAGHYAHHTVGVCNNTDFPHYFA